MGPDAAFIFTAPEGAAERVWEPLSPLPGLRWLKGSSIPRLTPWATFCRPSGPVQAVVRTNISIFRGIKLAFMRFHLRLMTFINFGDEVWNRRFPESILFPGSDWKA